jgi:diguanylate cyclase (GGDEF)-like protein
MAGFSKGLVAQRYTWGGSVANEEYLGNIGVGREEATSRDVLISHVPLSLVTAIGAEKILTRARLFQDPALPMLTILEVEETADEITIVYDYPTGMRPLLDVIRERTLTGSIELCMRLCEAVGALHERVLWHGGLLPDLVWVLPDGNVRLMTMLTDSPLELYNANGVHEWLDFFAPETLKRIPHDSRTDIYNLGVLFYFVFTGQMPVRQEDGSIEPPSEIFPHIPHQLDRIVLRMLNLSPSKRYHWIGQVTEELGRMIGRPAPDTYPHSEQISSRHLFTAEFVGREDAVSQVERLFKSMTEGESSRLLFVGQSGIGRKRVIYEALGRYLTQVSVISGRATEQRYGFVQDLAKRFFTLSFLEPETESVGMAYLGPLGRVFPSIAEAHRERFASLQADVESTQPLDALVYEFFIKVLEAHNHPLVFVLHEGHLLDPASLDMLQRLIEQKEWIVGLVGVADVETEALQIVFGPAVVHLAPLSVEDLRACLLSRLGSADFLHDEFIQWLNHHTQGSLSEAFTLLEHLVDSRQVILQRGIWTMEKSSVEELQIPESMDAVMLARVAALPAHAQELGRVMAMFKAAPALESIAHVLGQELAVLRESQYHLCEQRLIIQTGNRYQFASNGVKEQIYNSIPEQERIHLHARLAGGLLETRIDYGELAYQLEQGERYEQAICVYLTGARRSYRNDELAESEAQLRKARELYQKVPHRTPPSSLDAKLALTLNLSGKMDESAALYLRLYQKTRRLHHFVSAMVIFTYTENYRRITPHLDAIRAQLAAKIRAKDRTNLLTVLGLYSVESGQDTSLIVDIERFHKQNGNDLRRELTERDYLIWIFNLQELLKHIPDASPEQRVPYLQEAATLAEHHGFKRHLVPIYMSIGDDLLYTNTWKAKEYYLKAMQHAGDFADHPNQAILNLHLANTCRLRGNLYLVQRYMEQANVIGTPVFGAEHTMFVQREAELCLFLEDYDKADRAIARLSRASKLHGHRKMRVQAFLYRFQSLVDQGRERHADRMWPAVQDLCRKYRMSQDLHLLHAKYDMLKGNLRAVAALFPPVHAERVPAEQLVRLELIRIEALERLGQTAEGIEAGERLLKLTRSSGCFAYLAWVHLVLGRLNRRTGQFVAAATNFRRALSWFRRLHHQPRLYEIENLLRAEDQESTAAAEEVFEQANLATPHLAHWVHQIVAEKEELIESLNEYEVLLESLRRINGSIMIQDICVHLAANIFEKAIIDRFHIYVRMRGEQHVRWQFDEQLQEVSVELPDVEEVSALVRETGAAQELCGRDAYLYGVPILAHDSQVIAALVLEKWTVQSPFTEPERRYLHNLAGLVSSNIENGIMYEVMITDNLTGLYLRNYFMKRLYEEFGKVQRYGIDLSFLMIDLDNFSQINNNYGHNEGDRVLREVAQTLKRSVRQVDIVGRFGGEELIVVLPNTSGPSAKKVAERILQNLRAIPTDGTYVITASIGISSCDLDAPRDADDLFEKADQAETYAKRTGKNRIVCHWEL